MCLQIIYIYMCVCVCVCMYVRGCLYVCMYVCIITMLVITKSLCGFVSNLLILLTARWLLFSKKLHETKGYRFIYVLDLYI